MARLRQFKFDGRTARIDNVAAWHRDSGDALGQFYSAANPNFGKRFALYSPAEVIAEGEERWRETDVFAALGALSALEAALREDFIIRCIKRGPDPLSLYFDRIYQSKKLRASLEDDILEGWKQYSTIPAHDVGQIKAAFKYRHWLAHGRYWEPKLAQPYDFLSVYQMATAVLTDFPLLTR